MSNAAQSFFLTVGLGQRYCLFHPPAGACRGAILYLPPFGEEMNKARRMAALQARALAAQGYGVLQLDLYGCGDSSGELRDARWAGWLDDAAAAAAWLTQRLDAPLTLWGLRLGALLALDFASRAAMPIERLILWQPVQHGATFIKQFLRLLTANDMLADGAGQQGERNGGTAALRAALLDGQILEVAGYELAPALATAIETKDAASLAPAGVAVHWYEAVSAADRPMPPAVTRVADAWRAQGVDVQLQAVPCAPFWATQEITICPELLAATAAALPATGHELSRTSA
jgi:exosortase A-associated hydrolase 2